MVAIKSYTTFSKRDWKDNLSSPEAVVSRCSSKQVFLKISQISPKNTCIGVSWLLLALPIIYLSLDPKLLCHIFLLPFERVFLGTLLPSRKLHVKILQQKHQKLCTILKVNNKDTRAMSVALFVVFVLLTLSR